MSLPWTNKLYYGDNLDIMRRHIATESVDLIYLDPLRIVTIKDILDGSQVEFPRARDGWQLQAGVTFKRAKRKSKNQQQPKRLL